MPEQTLDVSAIASDDRVDNMYLTFQVAAETYAVNILHVTEIVGVQRIAEIPDVPAYIKGAMNLRGKVVPVMDQRLRFGLPERAYDERTTIVVLDVDGVATGLVVDRVTDVVTIPPDKIDPPPHWRAAGDGGVVKGLGRLDEQVSVILDVRHLVYTKNIAATATATADERPAAAEPVAA